MKRLLPVSVIFILVLATAALSIVITSRTDNIRGQQVGVVVVGNNIPLRIRYSAGDLNPRERADIVAQRLSRIDNLRPSDITIGRVEGYWGVLVRGNLLITADASHARANRMTTRGLATAWGNQLRSAISEETGIPVPSNSVPIGRGPGEIVNTAQKVVPILSVGSGLRVGVALVGGSSEQVDKVKAVAQLEGEFADRVRARVLVPIYTENIVSNIRRVPGTAVIGVANIKL